MYEEEGCGTLFVKTDTDPSAWMEAYLAAWWQMKQLPTWVVLGGLSALADEVGRDLTGREIHAGWRAWRVVGSGGGRMRVIG
jgi:hypothetical protein